MGLFGKKCLVCGNKAGLLGGKNIDDFKVENGLIPIPSGMGDKDVVCDDCYKKMVLENSDKIVESWINRGTSQYYDMRMHARNNKKSFVFDIENKYRKEHPDFFIKNKHIFDKFDICRDTSIQIQKLESQVKDLEYKEKTAKRANTWSGNTNGFQIAGENAKISAQFATAVSGIRSEIARLQSLLMTSKSELSAMRFNDDSYSVGSPVSGSPVSGSPISGSPVSGSPVSGSPISGSPVSEVVNNTKQIENEDPVQILKLRYAKGEISKEEFEEMKKLLE